MKLDNAGSMKRLRDALRASVFSPPPLKFRTAGFPQYGFKREVNANLRRETRLIRRSSRKGSPLWPLRACRAGWPIATLSSRGPWLADRLSCPARSVLTMASSEPLAAAARLISFVREALWRRVGPQFKRRVCSCMPSPGPRWTGQAHLTVASLATMVFAIFAEARHP